MTLPSPPVPSDGRPLVLAHRGDWLEGPDRCPQNSAAAVLAAVMAGADGAEVDARMSATGTIVLHHDPVVGPADVAAGCPAALGTPICDLAGGDLAHLSTLAELLDELAARAAEGRPNRGDRLFLLNIELKDLPGEPAWDPAYPLAGAVARLLAGGAADLAAGVVVSSFDAAAVDWYGRHQPGARTALLVDDDEDWLAKIVLAPRAGAINPAETVASPDLFREAALRGLAVFPWTVDSEDRARELAALGASGLITNRPRAMMAALAAKVGP